MAPLSKSKFNGREGDKVFGETESNTKEELILNNRRIEKMAAIPGCFSGPKESR